MQSGNPVMPNMATLSILELKKYLQSISCAKIYGFTNFDVSDIVFMEIIRENRIIWQPCDTIWQPYQSYGYENITNRFIGLKYGAPPNLMSLTWFLWK